MPAAATLTDDEVAAALARHPRIGERAGAGHDAAFSAREQAAVAPDDELMTGNKEYERRFGRVFLIRAAGRTAPEILAELRRRLDNDEATQQAETVAQLREIALLRLPEVVGSMTPTITVNGQERPSRGSSRTSRRWTGCATRASPAPRRAAPRASAAPAPSSSPGRTATGAARRSGPRSTPA